jgi:tetratricopeptide (TPR) repeat protein
MEARYFRATLLWVACVIENQMGDPRLALDLLDLALEANPEFPLALNLRGNQYFQDGQLDLALLAWKSSLALLPQQPDIQALVRMVEEANVTRDDKRRTLLLSLVNLSPPEVIQKLVPEVQRKQRDGLLVRLLATSYLLNRELPAALKVLVDSREVGRDPELTYLAGRVDVLSGNRDRGRERFVSLWSFLAGYRDSLVWLSTLDLSQSRDGDALARIRGLRESSDAESGLEALLLARRSHLAGRPLEARQYLAAAARHRLPSSLRSALVDLKKHTTRSSRR